MCIDRCIRQLPTYLGWGWTECSPINLLLNFHKCTFPEKSSMRFARGAHTAMGHNAATHGCLFQYTRRSSACV